MTVMPVVERVTAEQLLARPNDPRERGPQLSEPLREHQLEPTREAMRTSRMPADPALAPATLVGA